jgi:rare lipoprotein A
MVLMSPRLVLALVLSCMMMAGQAKSPNGAPPERAEGKAQKLEPRMHGRVSFYGRTFSGRRTANGERFDPSALTMAHPTLPFGTLVRVTHLKNKRSVIVRVNDRGPFAKGRVGDLSFAAAQKIGIVHRGVAPVTMSIVTNPETKP